jgi:hypothetical protein
MTVEFALFLNGGSMTGICVVSKWRVHDCLICFLIGYPYLYILPYPYHTCLV